jgi:cytochrome c oxidase subunit II
MNLLAKLVLQDIAGIITLTGALLVVAVVIFLMITSKKGGENGLRNRQFFKTKDRYFWGTILLVIFILFLSLRLLPHPDYKGEADEVVTVVGVQWDWLMAVGQSNQNPAEFIGKNEITVSVNKRIRFIITSSDVTHSFAIYDKSGTLLTQIQAMPQYKNELEYIFTEKGKYSILCLEYCGLAHPFMAGTIHVN